MSAPRPLRPLLGLLSRSCATSIAGSIAELAVLMLLQALGIALIAAFALVQLVGISMTFAINKYWVFGAGASGRIVGEGAKAIIVFVGSLALNTALPSVGSYNLHLSPLVAYALSAVMAYACWSFPLNRWWVFPANRPA